MPVILNGGGVLIRHMGKKSRLSQLRRSPPRKPRAQASVSLASSLHIQGEMVQAQALYRQVLQSDPRNFDALHLSGVLSLQVGRLNEGISLIEAALRIRADHAQALANLGNGYLLLNRAEEALRSYDRALAVQPSFAGVLNNRGNALQSLGRHDEAAEAFARLVQLAPEFEFALGNDFHSRRQGYDWGQFPERAEAIVSGVETGRRVDRPFSFLSVSDSAARQQQCARIYASYLCPAPYTPLWRGEVYDHERIRLAYVSADFRDHVVSRFMTPLYERHDRDQFQVIGVSLAADDCSAVVARSKRALDQFIDASRMGDQEVASRLRELEVDVAIDLTGYTQGCRAGVFARRPAPAQVNFLGYPATLGVPWIDYIIADEFVIPESLSHLYTENVVRLPDSFQPNDEHRPQPGAASRMTRVSSGLPADASVPVLCCFSNHYKLNPAIFDIWMRVLARAPNSVLWLLGGPQALRQRLQQAAESRGISCTRLIFAERVCYEEHLSRLALADLFLDTLPFNAGATASDALWAGVPVLTCAGEAFASRMAGSLLRAINMPDLITSNPVEYEERAVELLTNRERLQILRSRLTSEGVRSVLFNGARYCRHLEDAYRFMVKRSRCGDAPSSVRLPARL
jgi:predicted O-linked N-acetylglucosamine transferase (SPINDLY family)